MKQVMLNTGLEKKMKISVCSDALFMGKDYGQAMKELANAGFRDIEFWTWWDKDLSLLKSLKKEHDINFITFCTKFSSLTDVSKLSEYKQGLIESIAAAKEIGCKMLISQVGDELIYVDRSIQHYNIVDGLKEMAPLVEKAGILLLIEPLNTRIDHKGYYMWDSDEAFEIVGEVGSANVKVLFDIYHQQIMQGDLLRRIEANINKIAHFHAAGNPGRHELEAGELNYRFIIDEIKKAGYKGYFGLEYFPVNKPEDGLKSILSY